MKTISEWIKDFRRGGGAKEYWFGEEDKKRFEAYRDRQKKKMKKYYSEEGK